MVCTRCGRVWCICGLHNDDEMYKQRLKEEKDFGGHRYSDKEIYKQVYDSVHCYHPDKEEEGVC